MDTQQENQIPDVNVNSAESSSVGKSLRAAREKMELSVNDVANRIKFAPKQIESLEADAYEQLPEAAFVRGFVRSYARLLELDPATLISALPSSHVKTAGIAQEVKSVEIPMPTELTARRYNIALLAVGLVIALAVAIYERMNNGTPQAPEPVVDSKVQVIDLPNVAAEGAAEQLAGKDQPVTAAQPAAHTAVTPAPQKPVPPAEVRAAPAAAAPVVQATAPQPVLRAAPAPTPAPVQAVKPAPAVTTAVVPAAKPAASGDVVVADHSLRLEFDEDSWVEIKDVTERVLTSKMHRAGSLVRMTGKAPISVTIGNARAVRLFDNGKQINLERYTTAEVAHITLK